MSMVYLTTLLTRFPRNLISIYLESCLKRCVVYWMGLLILLTSLLLYSFKHIKIVLNEWIPCMHGSYEILKFRKFSGNIS